jgi:hypothetical protein
MPSSAPALSLMDDEDFLVELEKIETGIPTPQPVSRPPFWEAQERARTSFQTDALAIEVPDEVSIEPQAEVSTERVKDLPAAFQWPQPAAPVWMPPQAAVAAPRVERSVPRRLAALVILLGVCLGATGAAFVFHGRVEQIVETWTAAGR